MRASLFGPLICGVFVGLSSQALCPENLKLALVALRNEAQPSKPVMTAELARFWGPYRTAWKMRLETLPAIRKQVLLAAYERRDPYALFLERVGFFFDVTNGNVTPPELFDFFSKVEREVQNLVSLGVVSPNETLLPKFYRRAGHGRQSRQQMIPVDPRVGARAYLPLESFILSDKHWFQGLARGYLYVAAPPIQAVFQSLVLNAYVPLTILEHDLAHVFSVLHWPSYGAALRRGAARLVEANVFDRFGAFPPQLRARAFFVTEVFSWPNFKKTENLRPFLSLPAMPQNGEFFTVHEVRDHLSRLSFEEYQNLVRHLLNHAPQSVDRLGGAVVDLGTSDPLLKNQGFSHQSVLALLEELSLLRPTERDDALVAEIQVALVELSKFSPDQVVDTFLRVSVNENDPLIRVLCQSGVFSGLSSRIQGNRKLLEALCD